MKMLRNFSRVAVVATVLSVSCLSAMDDVIGDIASGTLTGADAAAAIRKLAEFNKPLSQAQKTQNKILNPDDYKKTVRMTQALGVVAAIAHTVESHDVGLTCDETLLYSLLTGSDWKTMTGYFLVNGSMRCFVDNTTWGDKIKFAPEEYTKTNAVLKEVAINAVPVAFIALRKFVYNRYVASSPSKI
jgi:hypothetical protein